MERSTRERTGLIVVRVWLEGPASDGFRARIMGSRGAERQQTIETTDSPEVLMATVRRWVALFLDSTDELR